MAAICEIWSIPFSRGVTIRLYLPLWFGNTTWWKGLRFPAPLTQGEKGSQLAWVEAICGLTPEAWRARPPFDRLVAISPDQRFHLGDNGNPTMRMVELVAYIGLGTRGRSWLRQAGKTRILEEVAAGIRAEKPRGRGLLCCSSMSGRKR